MKYLVIILFTSTLLVSCGEKKQELKDYTKLPQTDEAAIGYVDYAKKILDRYFDGGFVTSDLDKEQTIEFAYLLAKENVDVTRLKASCERVIEMWYSDQGALVPHICKIVKK